MILEFIPRLPTKEAYDNLLFRNGIQLKDLSDTLKEKLGCCSGCIFTKGMKLYEEFSSVSHLSILLKDMKPEDELYQIFVYGIGYFRRVR